MSNEYFNLKIHEEIDDRTSIIIFSVVARTQA